MAKERKTECAVALVALLMVFGARGLEAAESASTRVYLNSRESLLWHTAPARPFVVRWQRPAGATSATLSVKGAKYSNVYGNLEGEELQIALPPVSSTRDENVYSLTLSFDDAAATSMTAVLGAVTGTGSGGNLVSVPLRSPSAATWPKFSRYAVVHVPHGSTSLTVNGSEIEPALDGSESWRAVKYSGASEYRLELSGEAGDLSASLSGSGGGFALVVR